MDETWYKRAVDQHSIEPESFVFSVPFDVGNNGKPLVTATHAVFIEHKGHRAPVAVVGLQFQHSVLASHFLNNITSATVKYPSKSIILYVEIICFSAPLGRRTAIRLAPLKNLTATFLTITVLLLFLKIQTILVDSSDKLMAPSWIL